MDLINQKEIQWGALEDSLDEKLAKEAASKGEMGKAGGKEGDKEDAKKQSLKGKKPGSNLKKLKKEKTTGGAAKGFKAEVVGAASMPWVKVELVLPSMTEEWEAQALVDLRNRAWLGSNALPSVNFYSFINTQNGLNCASVSTDGALVVEGFSDSSLKLWDMTKAGDAGAATLLSEHCLSNRNAKSPLKTSKGGTTLDNNSKATYRLFHGHAGPVYAANFSLDGNYLLSVL